MNTTTRTALRTAIATTVLAGAVAVPTAAFAADANAAPSATGSAQPAGKTVDIGGGMEAEIKDGKAYLKEIGSGKVFAVLSKGQTYTDGIYVHFDGQNVTAKTQGDDKKKDQKKDDKKGESSRTVKLNDGKYAVITKLGDGSYKAVITGPDGFVFGTLTAASPSVTLDGGLKVTLDQKTGKITQATVKSRNGEAARDTSAKDAAVKTPDTKKLPKGGVAAGEAPEKRSDTDPGMIGGALAAAGVLGGAGLLAARRRKGER
ncbi:hypothetical protein QZH56_19660 [Streptomyces olivoreticuli]|uniref:hypothetical protein n=1 Tax=Streptomyces olivoreticuli TaxID=68246 RepID=UPI0026586171|nr:hypothetical protein [Streptomyces olivoreticuli]WKK21092.1 hypothetical protein QZH56_19660 [Streptomyces olivoreticuli]